MKLRRKPKKSFILFFVIFFLLFALTQTKGEGQGALSKKEMISIFGGNECTDGCQKLGDCNHMLELARCVGMGGPIDCTGNCIACGAIKPWRICMGTGTVSCNQWSYSCGPAYNGNCNFILEVGCYCVSTGTKKEPEQSCGSAENCANL